MQTTSKLPRGLRNNNPLNIRLSPANHWQGEITPSTDPDFCQFESLVMGLRAAVIIIMRYITVHHCDTIESIIRRWAPEPNTDHVQLYIDYVARRSCLGPRLQIRRTDKNHICLVIWAMAAFECGQAIPFQAVENAYALATQRIS